MRSQIYRSVFVFAVVIAGLHATSFAAVQNRITSVVQENSRAALVHTVAPRAARAADLGAAPSSLPLQNMTMRFSMTDAQQVALSQLLIDQQNPASPHYHQWLTPQQFGAQFGLSANDLAKVASWLTAQGFTVTSTAKSSTFITFSGTVGQAEQAFGTTIHNLSLNGERHMGNLTEPTLPTAIAGVVSNISGLDDFRLKPHARVRQLSASPVSLASHPKDTITVSDGSLLHFIAPGDFATIYNSAPLLSSSVNGTGITIAVMGQVDLNSYLSTDVAAFRVASNLGVNTPTQQLYGANPGAPTVTDCNGSNPPDTCNDVDESELDVEWAGAVAPSARIIFATSTDVIGISLINAIDNNLAPIMTVSYGGCEVQNFSTNAMNTLNQYFQQANAEGITIVGPSGDSGATDCDPISPTVSQTTATHGLAVDFPASSPFVTGIGGTEFSEGADAGSPGVYWSNTVNSSGLSATGVSAHGYIPEQVWNDTVSEISSSPTTASLSASGGGASAFFAKPVWQTVPGVPADGKRDVPDLAFSASAEHDAYLVCAIGSCQNGTYFPSAGNFNAFGGTSVSTPSFAGILALVEQKLGGARIGNANPYIYALANGASYSTIFHDVTTGDNKQPCTIGTTGCTSSPIGFSAGPGYDQATGWGSLNIANFANGFSSAITTPLLSSTTLSVAPSIATPPLNTSVNITATIAHTASAVPTGTVSFSVDGGASTSETVTATGTAVLPVIFTTCGDHTILATYNGDGNYYGSDSTKTIVAATTPCSFTLTPSSTAISIASGGNINSTITIASVNGYTGIINLLATGNNLNGSAGFSTSASCVPVQTGSNVEASVTITPGGSSSCILAITGVSAALKTGGSLKNSGGNSSSLLAGGIATLAGLLLLSLPGMRRKRWPTLFSLLAIVALMTSAGCGSTSNSTSTGTTTAGTTYPITITGSDNSGTITASTTINVTFQ